MSPRETQNESTSRPKPVATSDSKPVDPRALANLKHGLTGARLYFQDQEQMDEFSELRMALLAEFAPATQREADLANQLITDRWRLMLAAELDTKIMRTAAYEATNEPASVAQAKTWLKHGDQISRIALYENRIQSRYERTLAEFERLQASRKAALEAALEEAAQLAELAQAEGETEPDEAVIAEPFTTRNFEFSAPQIAYLLAHYLRLQRARALAASKNSAAAPPQKALRKAA